MSGVANLKENIYAILEKIDGMLEDNKKIHSYFDTIVSMLEEGGRKLDRLLVSGGEKERLRYGDNGLESRKTDQPQTDSKLPETRIHSPGFDDYVPPNAVSNFALPKTGKYQWYRLKNDDKVKLRRCSNEGCPMFLKFNEDKKKYEHWKYDANTGVGGYVQDICEYYEGMG